MAALDGYDLVMLGILAAAGLLGYFKGFVWQVAWIAGIAASSFVALRFSAALAPFCGQQPPWNRLIAMLALYVATSLVVWLVFRVVSGAINAVHLAAFDRQLGLLFGLAKGALLCVVVTFFAVTLAPAYRGQIVGSRSGRLVAEVIVRADELLPREISEAVEPFVRQFEEQMNGTEAAAIRPAGQPSALQAIWEGVRSASAWTGSGPGGQGAPAADWGWSQQPQTPGMARPASSGFTHPAGGTAWPPSPPGQIASPAMPAAYQEPARFQPAPQPFPVGSQSPLPAR
jgi:membrane protein required for colicin V production